MVAISQRPRAPQATSDATPDRIRDALAHVPADDRDLWFRMGAAIKHELGDAGLDIFVNWSATSERFRERDALAVWRSIKLHGPRTTIKAGTLYHIAKTWGWRPTRTQGVRPRKTAPMPQQAAPTPRLRWSTRADTIWRRARPLTGSDVASRYLTGRACVLPPKDGDLRWMPASERHPWPSMVARITDAITCEPMSLHFTYLALDGTDKAPTDRQRLLLAGHAKAGGVIRLWPNEAVTTGLAIAEGIETALAAAHGFTPIWSCIDAGNLAALPVLEGVEAITIMADHDNSGAGQQAAEACARRWHEAGREVRIVMAPCAGDDMSDMVTAP